MGTLSSRGPGSRRQRPERGVGVPAVLASWHEKGERACRCPCKRSPSGSKASGAKHNRITRRTGGGTARTTGRAEAARLPRRPAPGVAQSFPWHLLLLSQQPQDGQALGSAAGWRREIDFLGDPATSAFLRACPSLAFCLCSCQVRGLESTALGSPGCRWSCPAPSRWGCASFTATPRSAGGTFQAPSTFTSGNSRPDHAKQQKCPVAHSEYN